MLNIWDHIPRLLTCVCVCENWTQGVLIVIYLLLAKTEHLTKLTCLVFWGVGRVTLLEFHHDSNNSNNMVVICSDGTAYDSTALHLYCKYWCWWWLWLWMLWWLWQSDYIYSNENSSANNTNHKNTHWNLWRTPEKSICYPTLNAVYWLWLFNKETEWNQRNLCIIYAWLWTCITTCIHLNFIHANVHALDSIH